MVELELIRLEEAPLDKKRIASYASGIESGEQLASRMAAEHGYHSDARLGWHVRFEPNPRPYAEPKEFVELYLL